MRETGKNHFLYYSRHPTRCSYHQLVIFPDSYCKSRRSDNKYSVVVVSIVKGHCKRFFNVLTFQYICELHLYFDKKLKPNKKKHCRSYPFFRKKKRRKIIVLPTNLFFYFRAFAETQLIFPN